MTDTVGPRRRITKGHERRQAIAEAGAAVLREAGIDGLTHRAVATRANVPLGATTYYFTSRDDLLLAAVEHTAAESTRWMHTWGTENLGKPLEVILPQVVYSYLVDDRDQAIFDLEVYLLAARRPQFREALRVWSEQFVDVLTQFVDRDLAMHLDATVNGYCLISLSAGAPSSVEEVRRILAPALVRLS